MAVMYPEPAPPYAPFGPMPGPFAGAQGYAAYAFPSQGAPSLPPWAAPPASLMQALQSGVIPRVSAQPSLPAYGWGGMVSEPRGAPPARDATALLSLILSNAQVQDALRRAAVQHSPADVRLTMPLAPGSSRRDVVPLPMNAVVQAIAALAQRSTLELDETSSEEDDGEEAPREFLLSESGDLLVDPADPFQRADLVAHYFRCAAQAERGGV